MAILDLSEEQIQTASMKKDRAVNTDQLWTVKEVAQYLRLTPETIRAMARRGQLPGVKVGRSWRFRSLMIKNLTAADLSGASIGAPADTGKR